jgi:DNA polymerase III subunit gamma/tau
MWPFRPGLTDRDLDATSSLPGDVAQLGERLVRNEEVGGSSPLISTMFGGQKSRDILAGQEPAFFAGGTAPQRTIRARPCAVAACQLGQDWKVAAVRDHCRVPQIAWPTLLPPADLGLMSYQVLARKWRPQTFQEIVGQEHVTTTLSNALARDRVAHAYLFTGPRGCGKTTMARLMAKALNCDEGPTATPCGKCPSCESIASGNFLDVLEIDAASNTGVDNIRELRENAQYQPSAGKKRVFIVDEVHMLSKGAFNALLKILEEPPVHVHFIFATTEPVRIPRTILSRCQRFDFRLFTQGELLGRLEEITSTEKLEISSGAIELLSSLAEGSMRDALSLLDQAISSTEGELDADGILKLYGLVGHEPYLDLNRAILAHDPRAALDLVQELVGAGHDVVEFARALVGNFRDLMMLRLDPALSERIEKPEAVRQQLAEQAQHFETADLMHLAQRAADHYVALQRAPQPRWLLETQVVEYATLESRVLLSEILGRLEAGAGGPVAAPSGGGGGKRRRQAAKLGPETPVAPPEQEPVIAKSRSTAATSTSAAEVSEPKVAPVVPPSADVEASPSPAGLAVEAGTLADESWKRFVAAVHTQNIAVGTCLVEAAPRHVDGAIELCFKPEHAFHRDQVNTATARKFLAQAAAEVYGPATEVRVVVAEAQAGEDRLRSTTQEEIAPDQQQEIQRRAKENPHLERLLDGLGGLDSTPDE